MTAVTIDLTTMLATFGTLGAGLVAWSYRQARTQTRVEERVNWLCSRYAEDHDTAVPWEEPITDGGFPVDEEPDGDALAPHHFWIGVAVAAFGFGSVWRYYPTTGAVMTGLGLLVAADDAIEHIFGVPTPLDTLWARAILPLVRRWER
jgi:hypothetical protein